MPRRSGRVPSYCLHKASGQAVVRINSRDYYLGSYGSDRSHAEYEQLISEWRSRRKNASPVLTSTLDPSITISELILHYHKFAQTYYAKDGELTKEFKEMSFALKPVRKLYGTSLAREFGPLKLQAVRQHMIDVDLSRGVINNRVNRIKRCFKWAVSEELIPPAVFEGLRAVVGLRRGRTAARETGPVLPVDDVHVDAIFPHVVPQVAAMVRLQRMTGMRPCEVVMIRVCEIDMTKEIWIYTPADHKNSWRGHERHIPIGPKAQELIKPFLKLSSEAFLFSPKEAEAHRNAIRKAKRKSPMTPSHKGRVPKANPKRPKRDHYGVDTYRRAIKYAIKKVNRDRKNQGLDPIPDWFPLQLRHSRATELNENYGIEAAAVSLGHAHAEVTKVYAERNLKLAIEIARKTG